MVVSMDETFENVSESLKKFKEFRNFHNNLIDRIIVNKKN